MSVRRPDTGRPSRLAAALQREARVAEQTRPLRHALRQTERYTDLRGHHHELPAMSGPEPLLVLALLERHADTLHAGELAEHLLSLATSSASERHEAIGNHHRLAATGAAEWLRQTPLHRALTQRASQ